MDECTRHSSAVTTKVQAAKSVCVATTSPYYQSLEMTNRNKSISMRFGDRTTIKQKPYVLTSGRSMSLQRNTNTPGSHHEPLNS
ncbi:hypothetical protein TNCV_4750381 [Trichonephila clavipes]|nr:hypothetical protein TNCV_4750381 [Trichonephila clavipes]